MSIRGAKPRILMCAPEHFAVAYTINPWMDPASWHNEDRVLAAIAWQEWQTLRDTLAKLGAEIDLVPPAHGLPDLVFTANAAVVMHGKALLARFRHRERRGEEEPYRRAFETLRARGIIDSVASLPEGIVLEGAGDCVWDRTRRLFWMGYGQRSDAAAAPLVADMFGIETVALRLPDPHFYHMDTTLCPLTHGELLYYPGGFTLEGLAQIRARVAPEQRIEIGSEDAATLAANAVCLGDAVVASTMSADLRRRLEERGYTVHLTPLGAFRRSGGSAFCLTLRLDHGSAWTDRPSTAKPARIKLSKRAA